MTRAPAGPRSGKTCRDRLRFCRIVRRAVSPQERALGTDTVPRKFHTGFQFEHATLHSSPSALPRRGICCPDPSPYARREHESSGRIHRHALEQNSLAPARDRKPVLNTTEIWELVNLPRLYIRFISTRCASRFWAAATSTPHDHSHRFAQLLARCAAACWQQIAGCCGIRAIHPASLTPEFYLDRLMPQRGQGSFIRVKLLESLITIIRRECGRFESMLLRGYRLFHIT